MGIYKRVTAVVATALAVTVAVSVMSAVVPVAAIADKIDEVLIRNTSSEPVPVVSPPPPLWQGEPYVATSVIFGAQCADMGPIPEGKVLFVERVTTSFNVAPGRGGQAALAITPLNSASLDYLYVPAFESGPVEQAFGVYDGYQGVVDVGLPTAVRPKGCFFAAPADDLRGRIIVTGYLVPAE